MSLLTVDTYPEIAGVEVRAEVLLDYKPGHPGKLYGPPENCFPPEPSEVEIMNVVLYDTGKGGSELDCPAWLKDAVMDYVLDVDAIAAKADEIYAQRNED